MAADVEHADMPFTWSSFRELLAGTYKSKVSGKKGVVNSYTKYKWGLMDAPPINAELLVERMQSGPFAPAIVHECAAVARQIQARAEHDQARVDEEERERAREAERADRAEAEHREEEARRERAEQQVVAIEAERRAEAEARRAAMEKDERARGAERAANRAARIVRRARVAAAAGARGGPCV